jgi:hypothetical protein
MKTFIDEKKVSQMTGFALPTIRNWRFLRRNLSYIKFGRSIRYDMDEVLAFMSAHKVILEDVTIQKRA